MTKIINVDHSHDDGAFDDSIRLHELTASVFVLVVMPRNATQCHAKVLLYTSQHARQTFHHVSSPDVGHRICVGLPMHDVRTCPSYFHLWTSISLWSCYFFFVFFEEYFYLYLCKQFKLFDGSQFVLETVQSVQFVFVWTKLPTEITAITSTHSWYIANKRNATRYPVFYEIISWYYSKHELNSIFGNYSSLG